MPQLDLIATAAFGLEAVVAAELKALGYKSKILHNGRVLLRADEAALCRANLWLRTADRVVLRLGTFAATDFGQLFDQTFAIAWENWLPADAAFPVNGRSVKSQLSSVPACQKIVKKAIVERLRKAHRVEALPETGALYTVEVALLDDQATLTLDTTGPGLNKRGYRTLVGEAQLKETLAAALVLLSGWQADRPLLDPFCGTGTIPIEAAMIARNRAPGLGRTFAAESWPTLPPQLWRQARQEAGDLVRQEPPLHILGSDVDEAPLSLARYHAKAAGVAADVQFQQRDFRDLTSKRQYGHVICNPPYGERLGERTEVEALYRSMPAVLGRLPTWSHGILTSHGRFERLVGRQADRRRKLYNGPLECYYYQFDGPQPHGAEPGQPAFPQQASVDEPAGNVRVRRPADIAPEQKTPQQAELFASRLGTRARHLRRWSKRGIGCYQLYDRDVPEIPLTVDRYEDNLHIVEHDRPHQRSPEQHAAWLDAMAATAAEVLELPPERVFMHALTDRRPPLYDSRDAERNVQVVSEAALRFRVNLADYSDTGLLLDYRLIRSRLRESSAGKRFLSLFGYTGAFTVAAAAGGASSTTTVDLFPTHLHWARENMLLNGFESSQHRFELNDALSFLQSHPAGAAYDLVVIDPPDFSDRTASGDWELERDHVALLTRLADVLSPGGEVFFLARNRRFKLAEARLPQYAIRDISRQTVPEDFRNQRIHRCWRLRPVRGHSTVAP